MFINRFAFAVNRQFILLCSLGSMVLPTYYLVNVKLKVWLKLESVMYVTCSVVCMHFVKNEFLASLMM